MKLIYTPLLILLVLTGCQKEVISPITDQKPILLANKSTFADSAFQFLKVSLSAPDFDKLDVQSFQLLRIRNKDVGIKIFEKGSSGDNFIILNKTQVGFSGNRVSIEGVKTSKMHSGTIFLETLDRKFLKKYYVKANRVTTFANSQSSRATDICSLAGPPDVAPSSDKIIQQFKSNCELPEVIITGHADTGPVNFYSLYWMSGGNSTYYYYYTPVESSGGGGSGTVGQNNGAVAAPTLYSPDSPVSDVKNEVKCFTSNASASYTIAINVNQPVPGTREIFEPLSPFPVGHTFLTLRQVNPDGSEIVRNVGYYPKNMVKPGSTTDVATFGEDSNTPFDVSLKMNVSASEFMTVISNIVVQQKITYDLDNYNCTNSAIEALKSINIKLPETKSNSLFFGGQNPADLGEDIKSLNLENLSTLNGGRKIVRSVSNDNSQKPPAKVGGC